MVRDRQDASGGARPADALSKMVGSYAAKLQDAGAGGAGGGGHEPGLEPGAVGAETSGAQRAQLSVPLQPVARTTSAGMRRAGERETAPAEGPGGGGGEKRSMACCVVTERNAERGRLVVRGPSWQWDDQDGGSGCTGMLTHDEDEGWWRVKWEGEWWRANSYRVGGDGAYDLAFAAHACPCRRPAMPQPDRMPVVFNNRTKRYGEANAAAPRWSPPAVEMTSSPWSAGVTVDASLVAGASHTPRGTPAQGLSVVMPDGSGVRSLYQPETGGSMSYGGGGDGRLYPGEGGQPIQRMESCGNDLTMGTKVIESVLLSAGLFISCAHRLHCFSLTNFLKRPQGFRVGGLTPRGVGTSPRWAPGEVGVMATPRGRGWGGEEGSGGYVRQAVGEYGSADGARSAFRSNFIYTPQQTQKEVMPAMAAGTAAAAAAGVQGFVAAAQGTWLQPAPAGHVSYGVSLPVAAGDEEVVRQRELARQREQEIALERERARERELAKEREMVERERERDRERLREVEQERQERERVKQAQREQERAVKAEKERQRLKDKVRGKSVRARGLGALADQRARLRLSRLRVSVLRVVALHVRQRFALLLLLTLCPSIR